MSSEPTDFNDVFDSPSDDAAGDPLGFFDYVDPDLLIVGVVLVLSLLAAWGIGWYIGRVRAEQRIQRDRREAIKNIYEAIKFRLDDALSANGASVLDKAALLKAEIDSRLGNVMALQARPGKLMGVLSKTLREKTDPDAETVDLSWGKPEAAKIKVPLSSQEHQIAVWNALHAFQNIWKEEQKICKLMEDAQKELEGLSIGRRLREYVLKIEKENKPAGKGPREPQPPKPDVATPKAKKGGKKAVAKPATGAAPAHSQEASPQ